MISNKSNSLSDQHKSLIINVHWDIFARTINLAYDVQANN